MRVLLTGAGGFIGGYLAAKLLQVENVEVILSSRSPPKSSRTPSVAHFPADLANETDVERLVSAARPDIVVHAAGLVRGTAERLFRENAAATSVLVDALIAKAANARLIALGSASEYGIPFGSQRIGEDHSCSPVSLYGHAKLASTNVIRAASDRRGLRATILRIFNVVAPVNSPEQVLGAFIERAALAEGSAAPRKVEVGRLDAIRDFVSMSDLCDLVAKLVREGSDARVINVCSGEGHQIRDLITFMNELSCNRFEIEETGPAPSPGYEDCVVGDPSLFLRTLGVSAVRPIKQELALAWRNRMARLPNWAP